MRACVRASERACVFLPRWVLWETRHDPVNHLGNEVGTRGHEFMIYVLCVFLSPPPPSLDHGTRWGWGDMEVLFFSLLVLHVLEQRSEG